MKRDTAPMEVRIERCPGVPTDRPVDDDRWSLHFDPDPEDFICIMSGLTHRDTFEQIVCDLLEESGLTITVRTWLPALGKPTATHAAEIRRRIESIVLTPTLPLRSQF
jgi:hypothetical protein